MKMMSRLPLKLRRPTVPPSTVGSVMSGTRWPTWTGFRETALKGHLKCRGRSYKLS